MKITVILEKQARIYAQLPTNEAAEAFEKMADILIYKIEKSIEKAQPLTEVIKPAEIEKLPETLHDTEVKNVGKKLVIMKCPDCGAIGAYVVQEYQVSICCRHCEKDIPLEGLVHAKYLCPNCNWFADFYALGDLKVVKCKDCGSDIDLIYNDKKHCYLSANLVK